MITIMIVKYIKIYIIICINIDIHKNILDDTIIIETIKRCTV